jgi:hypothetical protein
MFVAGLAGAGMPGYGYGPYGPVGPHAGPFTETLDPADTAGAVVNVQPEERVPNGDCDCGDNCAEGNQYQKGTE